MEQTPQYDQDFKVGRDSVEPPAHEWDGFPLHALLGKAPLFRIKYLSARTARQESRPTLDTLLLFPPNLGSKTATVGQNSFFNISCNRSGGISLYDM
ncbi:hypothetical protein N8766_00390 [bacterium]|nr:hypothetical protein [bacterium]MDB4798097.1 hypothetical protein [Verrucomicrobiota bacterium]